MDVSVQVRELGQWVVATVDGDIDVATAPQVRERLVSLLAEQAPQLVVDLDGVGLLDSTGLGVLVGVLKRVCTRGGDMRLVCTQPSIRGVFELTGLDCAMPLAGSAEEAIASTTPAED